MGMTLVRRIFLNVAATYGRSLYALVIGLFCSRWVLQFLGKSDFGLYSVVGGLVVFISLANNVFAYSIGRFFALSVGRFSVAEDRDVALEDCQRWFSVAVAIHTIFPSFLMIVGYPIGIWMVRHFLAIPSERLSDCVWVFRFACCSCFLSMVAVPFQALYTARQKIAELTIYSFATITLNFFAMRYMVTHPGRWLVPFAAWTSLLVVVPQVLIALRARKIFPECRFRFAYCLDTNRLRSVFQYVGWQAFGTIGSVLRNQGVAIVVNKYFGSDVNAAMAIGNNVNAHAGALSGAMQGAFMPAITHAFGAGDLNAVRKLAVRTCKFSVFLYVIFCLPLAFEIREVLRLWLVDPPAYASSFVLCMMSMFLIDKSTIGHMVAIHATGRIAAYQTILGGALIATLPLAWLFAALGFGIYSICFAMVLMLTICAWGRLIFAWRILSMPTYVWIREVLLPMVLSLLVSALSTLIVREILAEGFSRLCVTVVVCEMELLPIAWFIALNSDERGYLVSKMASMLTRGRHATA